MLSSDTNTLSAKAASSLTGTLIDMAAQDHYTVVKIQPIEYIAANNMGFLEGNVIKYVSRYRFKNGIEDLKKAKVYLEWLIEREETQTITVKRKEN